MNAQPNPFAPHWLIRDIVIGSHLHAVGSGGLLFIGDSIVEGFYWNRIGSMSVLNAGYSGIWTEALEPKVPRLLEAAKPRLVALLVGANDAKKGRSEDYLDAVTAHFERLVWHSKASSVPFIVITPPPIEAGKRLTSFYCADAMASLSRRIALIAERQGADILDMHAAFSNENGEAHPGMTTDGIHLSGKAYRLMHDMLVAKVDEATMGRGDT